jgi:glycerol-3-phosphate dehydrogenase
MRREPERLAASEFDLLVIGAGIHGAWTALRAAEAGMTVALVERGDFACSTSSNSLGILHGGLRYLQQLDFGRFRSSVRSRREHARRSPHLVQPLPCAMPLAASGIRSPWVAGPALLLNDILSSDRNVGLARSVTLPRGRLLGSRECQAMIGPLADRDTNRGALWWDAQASDAPRLCLEAVISAVRAGAVAANHAEALSYLVSGETIRGAAVRDLLTGREFEIRASAVVNATGPAAGELALAGRLPVGYLRPWLGAMNVVYGDTTLPAAVALTAATRSVDGTSSRRRPARDLFFVPWRGALAVGTDYVPLPHGPTAAGYPAEGAVDAFLEEIGRVAARLVSKRDSVTRVHWGVLPTEPGFPAMPARSPVLAADEATGANGLIVVVGEKLTSAPELSLRVVALVRRTAVRRRAAPAGYAPSDTGESTRAALRGLPESAQARLLLRYGRQWPDVLQPYAGQPSLFEPLRSGHELLQVEVVHAIRHEMACDLEDLVLRRLALAESGRPDPELLQRCATIAATEFGWSAEDRVTAVTKIVRRLADPTQFRGRSNL